MLTIASERVAVDQEQKQTDMEQALAAINATYEDAQIVYEYELLYRELVQSHFEIAAAATKFQRASERVNKEIDNGTRLLADVTPGPTGSNPRELTVATTASSASDTVPALSSFWNFFRWMSGSFIVPPPRDPR